MKTIKWIPVILLGIGLSSTQQNLYAQKSDSFQQADAAPAFGDKCNSSSATTVTKDGEMYSAKMSYYRFSFCPDGSMMITNPYNNYMATGSWSADDNTGVAKFYVNGSDPYADTQNPFSWMNGDWKIIDRSSNSMEIQKYDPMTGSSWYAKFDEKAKYY